MKIFKPLKYEYNDGGRSEHFKGNAGDCVVRAIAIASGLPYMKVYLDLKHNNSLYAESHRDRVAKRIQKKGTSARDGSNKKVYRDYILSLGFEWIPTMQIGSGCYVHLNEGELPMGTIIARVSRHLVAVVGGVMQDTHDPSRGGSRCVYGYYKKA